MPKQIYKPYKKLIEKINQTARIYEPTRKKELFKGIFCIVLLVVLSIIAFCSSLNFYITSNSFMAEVVVLIAPIMLLCAIGAYYKLEKKDKEFRLMLKKQNLRDTLDVFENVKWKNRLDDSSSFIPNNILNSSGLFARYSIRYCDDEFEGEYQGVPYKISETRLTDIVVIGRGRSEVQIFKGIVIQLKSNKNIKNRTVVTTKGDICTKKTGPILAALLSLISCCPLFQAGFNWIVLVITIVVAAGAYSISKMLVKFEEPLKKVTLEDCKFDKKFNVYSSDEVEARYLITPSFMERLYNLQTSFGTKKIKCSFIEDSLIIAISMKRNLFEFGDLFHSLLNNKNHEQFIKDINSILKMIKYFKLNENIKI